MTDSTGLPINETIKHILTAFLWKPQFDIQPPLLRQPFQPKESREPTRHSTHPIRIPDPAQHRLPRRIPFNLLNNNLSRTHPPLLHIQPMLHRPQPLPDDQRLRSRNQQPLRQSPRNIVSPHSPPNLIPTLEDIARSNRFHPHTPRHPLLRRPANSNNQRFPLAALRNPRASPHGVVWAGGVVDAR